MMKTQSKTNSCGFALRALQPITLATALALSLFGGAAHALNDACTVLHHFAGPPMSDGANPYAGLVLDGDTLYGTTYNGGTNDAGTVFKLSTDGTSYTVLKNLGGLGGTNGIWPKAQLLLSGTTLYGTTYHGGTDDGGTVFKLSTDGTGFTVLKQFTIKYSPFGDSWPDGAYPSAGLIVSGSTLYGTTEYGGTNGGGTVFKLDTNGTGFTVLEHFGDAGASPEAALVLSGSTLYGTTYLTSGGSGGGEGYGTVFKIDTDGTGYTVLKYLDAPGGTNGMWPQAELLLCGSTLYGTTPFGGSSGYGTVFKLNTDGAGFTVLRNFLGGLSDARPYAGLVLSGGALYGTAYGADCMSCYGGEVFKLDTNGTSFAVINRFNTYQSGRRPCAGLVLSGTTLYGTSYSGGRSNLGTVFKLELAPQLGPISLSNSVPQIPVTGPGEVTLQIQVSTNLLSAWDLLTNLTLSYGNGRFSDPAATDCPMRLYRAVMQ
jgi:uncharacterized repeat protein (TIGR03803 family)